MRLFLMAAVVGSFGLAGAAVAQDAEPALEPVEDAPAAAESWLPSLITETPEEGFALAITLARRGVTTTQPDRDVLFMEREKYSRDADSLIAASQTIALHFQTIAAANDHWR